MKIRPVLIVSLFFLFLKWISYHQRLTRVVLVTLALAAALMGGVGTSLADEYVVEDAVAQFNALKHHGEAIGFILDDSEGAPDPSVTHHYQGVVRYPGTGTPYFYLTQKDDAGYLIVAKMGSRDQDGERLRSNLQEKGEDTEDTSPPTKDRYIGHFQFSSSLQFSDYTFLPDDYEHPGGMAIIDDVLFMALDTPKEGSGPEGMIVLFDLQDPSDPVPFKILELDHAIDNLAITQEDDGNEKYFLIWTNGDGGEVTKFYHLGTDLRAANLTLTLIQDWHYDKPEDIKPSSGELWPKGGVAYQSSAFVREAGGDLFLVMLRNDDFLEMGLPGTGDDYGELFQVVPKSGVGFKLVKKASAHFYCKFDESGRICNFGATGTAYVSPSGELILYSASHDDQDGKNPDFVRMGEFRHRDVNRPTSPLRLVQAEAGGPYEVYEGASVTLYGVGTPPRDRPWVELYDDSYYQDRSIVVDYDDRGYFELSNFKNLDGFGDKTSSVRWRAPSGLNIRLHDDKDYKDRWIYLIGNGQTREIGNLDSQKAISGFVLGKGKENGKDELKFNDKTSSMYFYGPAPTSPTVTLAWDLDGDTTFGDTGVYAENGDEIGATPTFETNGLDGPITITVTLRAMSGASAAYDEAEISVLNVPPVVTVDFVTDETGSEVETGVRFVLTNVQIDVQASFSDVGPDTHTAVIDWGDGYFTDIGAVEQGQGAIFENYVYTTTGVFTIRVEVDDGDDVGYATRSVTVVDPKEALELTTADLLILVEDLSLSKKTRKKLEKLLRDIGLKKNGAASGALEKLEKGKMSKALSEIKNAVDKIDKLLSDPDTDLDTDQLALLEQMAWILALTAKSVYVDLADAAGAVASKPKDLKKLAEAANLATEADTFLASGYLSSAVENWKSAVKRLEKILHKHKK